MQLPIVPPPLAAAACLAVSLALPAAVHAQSPRTAASASPIAASSLDSLITTAMQEAGIMGFSAAVIVDRRMVWMKGYGHADWQRRVPFTPTTSAKIASITKPFVGVAMMRAVHEGTLQLDADINRYLPFRVVNPFTPDAPITLRHLATHTSGITDRWAVYRDSYRFDGVPGETLHRFLHSYFTPGAPHYARENFLDARPGAMRAYSNIGASLAGYIVERAVGEPLQRYILRHIATPLQLTGTGWSARDIRGVVSTPFVSLGGFAVPIPQYAVTTWPDGGLLSSVADLSRFFIAMLNDGVVDGVRILDAASAAEMRRFQFTDANHPANYPATEGNSGLFWRTKLNGERVGHGGNDPGVEAEMQATPAGDLAVVYLSNTSLGGPERRATSDILDALWRYGAQQRASRAP